MALRVAFFCVEKIACVTLYGIDTGTGKTLTLIECILEVARNNPGARILACAPSDAAADVICTRLAQHFTPKEMFRLNWWQRIFTSVPLHLLNYTYAIHETENFDCPSDLSIFKIIVCTVIAAGIIPFAEKSEKFDLVLVDEVSQCTEAEAMVPISQCHPLGVIVLCGDPQQLGAPVRSPAYHVHGKINSAQNTFSNFLVGASLSLQQQLLKYPLYQDIRPDSEMSHLDDTNSSTFSRFGVYLRRNYRSHHSILTLPSRLFYHDSLLESGQVASLDSLGAWSDLRDFSTQNMCEALEGGQDRPFVMLFRGVDGRHRHETDSPSFYNTDEIEAVVSLCSSLLKDKSIDVSPRDIGIIGAFRSQVLKIRTALRASNMRSINVGGVEDFQGQESRIIIISTVLSHRIPQLELNGSLGLLGDHRKFNVAITRGMHLAIVVGQPYCLYSDPHWRQLLEYCDVHGAYSGYRCSLLHGASTEEELLNSVATSSLLGPGEDRFPQEATLGGGMSQYHGDYLEWRGLF